MATEEERCREAKRFQRIDDAFRKGDLDGLRAALDDPAVVPNGRMPGVMGVPGLRDLSQPSCLHPHTAGNRG